MRRELEEAATGTSLIEREDALVKTLQVTCLRGNAADALREANTSDGA